MQKLIEFVGPFRTGQRITVEPAVNTEYTHIGLQVPERGMVATIERRQDETSITPTTIVPDSWRAMPAKRPEISINGKQLCVSPTGILEFDLLGEIELNIQILQSLPKESIIDIIAYTR